MLTQAEYIRQSLKTNLFFLRIIKEHIIFNSAALTLRDAKLVPPLLEMQKKFEEFLMNTISLANGIVGSDTLAAGDIITPYTFNAETATQYLTGIPINTNITLMEAALMNTAASEPNPMIEQSVDILNQNIMVMLNATIQTQKIMLANVLSCKMFTSTYPSMLNHVIQEAEHYFEHLQTLQNRQSLTNGAQTAAQAEIFWNDRMKEHATYIRGLLDPTEEELIKKANGFADEFAELTEAARKAYNQLILLPSVTRKSIDATTNISKFKQAGTQGILECKIRSIILPLLSDHVLREANHFLKELQEFKF